jgi:hypothetical protein
MRKLIVSMIDLIILWESPPAAAQTLMSSLHRQISKKHTVAGRPRRIVARAERDHTRFPDG